MLIIILVAMKNKGNRNVPLEVLPHEDPFWRSKGFQRERENYERRSNKLFVRVILTLMLDVKDADVRISQVVLVNQSRSHWYDCGSIFSYG